MGKISIEVCGPKNENLAFAAAGGMLRGRWNNSVTAYADKSDAMKAMSAIPVIPGVHIWLDVKERKAGISDPLRETEEGRRIWGQVKNVLDRYPHAFGGGQVPSVLMDSNCESITRSELSIDDIKDWAFQMRTALDCGLAQYVPGSDQLPATDKIRAMPGRRKSDPWNTGRMENELTPWADAVEVPAVAKA